MINESQNDMIMRKQNLSLNLLTSFSVTFFCNVFQGFVISDWQGIDKITTPAQANYTLSVLDGISAVIDMVSSSDFLDILHGLIN